MGTRKNPNAKKASLSDSAKRRVTRSATISTRSSCLPPQTDSKKPGPVLRPTRSSHFPPPAPKNVLETGQLWQEWETDLMISLYKTGKTYAEISQQLPLRSKASVHYKLSYIFNTRKQDRDSLHKVTLVKGLVKRAQKEKWQAWETDLLVSLRETGKTYKAISQQLPGRSEAACFEKLMMGHIESKNWEAWEEELLISLYKRGNSLGEISQQMPSRSGESCRRRLLCLLKSGKQDRVEIPGNGQLWKDWEDQLIITHHDAGKSWAEISKLLPSRKETSVMKRWRKHLKPGERRNTRWSQAEDQLLTTLHNAHRGPEGWTKVAQKMPNRSEASCKNHWSKLLRCDPDLAKGVNFENRWTKLEREKVVSLVNAIGPRWYEIAKELPGRTEGACHSAYAKFCAEESGPSREYWLRSWDDPEETEIDSTETGPAAHVANEEVDLDARESTLVTSAQVVVGPTLRKNQHSKSYNAKKRQVIHVPEV